MFFSRYKIRTQLAMLLLLFGMLPVLAVLPIVMNKLDALRVSFLDEMEKLGGLKRRLEVKVFGGANVINNLAMIGSRNVNFIRRFLNREGFAIVSEDLGNSYPRRLRYYPDSGRALLMRLHRREDFEVIDSERKFAAALKARPVEGNMEIF